MKRLTEVERIEISKRYTDEKLSSAQLGRLYGVSGGCILKILKKHGIKTIPHSEKMRKYSLDQTFFEKIDTEEKAYFLGLLYADGYNGEKFNAVSLSLQEGDIDILNKFSNSIKSDRPLLFLKKREESHKNQFRLNLSSKKISQDLAKLGCVQNKSMSLTFPDEEQLPVELVRHFVRGYFDGDGHISKYSYNSWLSYNCIIISTEKFCQHLAEIVKNILDVEFSIKKLNASENNISKKMECHRRHDIKKFLDWIYEDSRVRMDRKHDKYKEIYLDSPNRSTI